MSQSNACQDGYQIRSIYETFLLPFQVCGVLECLSSRTEFVFRLVLRLQEHFLSYNVILGFVPGTIMEDCCNGLQSLMNFQASCSALRASLSRWVVDTSTRYWRDGSPCLPANREMACSMAKGSYTERSHIGRPEPSAPSGTERSMKNSC